MPQWAGSSWYFLRYIEPRNDQALADPEKLKYWMPVDWYNGGMEHVTRHVIYSRFWHHFLYDIGVVNTPEPYAKRSIQGLILGPDGDKMSKSKGNVVDPLDIVKDYGADTLRTYVLFMGDYSAIGEHPPLMYPVNLFISFTLIIATFFSLATLAAFFKSRFSFTGIT